MLVVGIIASSLISANADNNPVTSGLTPEMLRPDFSKLTPEAASLGRYGAFQVSEYSGAANISIPLYTVKSGEVSFPISLYYDCSGIKVEQDATFVGLGWNLSYGGIISHIVCGENDFLETRGYDDFNQNWWKNKIDEVKKRISLSAPFCIENYIEMREVKNMPYGYPQTLTSDMLLSSDDAKEIELYDRMAKGYDVPDVFQASFCGHNITFAVDKRKGKGANGLYPIIVLNNNPSKYKISYRTCEEDKITCSAYGYPSTFLITDDKGITYCFKGYCENYWSSKQANGGFDSYYLTKVYGIDGEDGKSVVKLEYEQDSIYFCSSSRIPSKSHKPTVKVISEKSVPGGAFNAFCSITQPNTYSAEIASGESGHCYKVLPSKIMTALETITFVKGAREDIPDAKSISGIEIKSKIGGSARNIKFTYDNFNETPAKKGHDYSHKRLKLTSVTIDDQKYKFEYDGQDLPSFASYSKDYWGYYNGANPNADCFVGCTPAYIISNSVVRNVEHLEGSNRLASEKLCNVGMLKKIVYPTGGYTEYEYEIHRFNDRYYYPDASHRITASTGATSQGSLSFYGSNTFTKTFNLKNKATLKTDISINSLGSKDTVNIIVKDSGGKEIEGLTINGPDKEISKAFSVVLEANKEYTVVVKCNASKETSSSTAGTCNFTSVDDNPILTLSPAPVDKDGGYSIGGGLRIKTIKNYDSNSTYTNGVKYEYSGGKLLSPTIQLETHYVDCNYEYAKSFGIHFSFNYANTEPSYLHISSIGIPATVGYDKVVKKEINENGSVTYRTTELEFHNYRYDSTCPSYQMNSIMQNAFYYPPYSNGHLNGMIRYEKISNGSVTISDTKYDYKREILDTIYYQKCLPLHIPIKGAVPDYNQGFFRKCNTWTYLTSKTSTIFDSNGKNPRTTTTSFTYNPSNYQVSEQKVCDSQNTSLTHYYYPLDKDNQSYGRSYLTDTHNISEVTAIDTYRNGTFVGGSRRHYTLDGSIPVVDSLFSILPDADKTPVLEMSVTAWDGYGNIREYRRKDDTPVVVVWSYNHQVPVLEIIGLPYSKLENGIKTTIEDIEKKLFIYTNDIENLYILLKRVKGIMVTACSYSPWQTASRIIKPNGYGINYNYDSNGRLIDTRDAFGILQKYNYNYKNK